MNKVGILGIKGRVGKSLVQLGCTPIDVDVSVRDHLKKAKLNDFDVIINCSAKTIVDQCQHNLTKPIDKNHYFNQALAVNSRALEYIRQSFVGRLIHLSTDYVFKGDKGPYDEMAKRDPVNDYGFTKLGGEVVLETNPWQDETIIVRTTGLFGSGNDYASFVLDHLQNNKTLVASKELLGNHTYIPYLCEALLHIAEMKTLEEFLYLHVASIDVMSRYDFALMLANVFELSTDHLFPCKNKDIAEWVAPRPTKGGLKVKKAQKLGIPLYSTLEGLQAYRRA